jgi:hypothetical protein
MRATLRPQWILAAAVLAVLFSPPAPGASPESPAAGTASGSFAIDGKTVKLAYAYAMAQPSTFDEKKSDTVILLTDKPIPESVFEKLKDLEDVDRGQKRNSILFKLDESGSAIREVIHHETLGDASLQMSGMTHADVKTGVRTKDRIEGAAQTKGDEEFLHHKYQVNARFNASIRQARQEEPLPDAKTGQKLTAGGGEPGKAYLALHAAIQKKDLAAVRKMKPADMPDMPDEELKKGLELMAIMTPAKVTINDGYVKGDTAVLYVSGTQEGQKQYATIRMARSSGAWHVGDEKWSDKPPSK